MIYINLLHDETYDIVDREGVDKTDSNELVIRLFIQRFCTLL